MLTRANTLAILYDPLSYYRPWRSLVANAPDASMRTGLNRYLVRHYRLPAYAPAPPAQALLTTRLVDSWHDLSSVAYLLACAKLRRHIVTSREYLSLPRAAHAFMQMDFIDEAVAGLDQFGERFDDRTLLGWGAAYLRRLHLEAPTWLTARIGLVFAGIERPDRERDKHPSVICDMPCLWSAIHYAARDTQLRHRLRH
jgi:type III secretion system OrgA/MxiK family protein